MICKICGSEFELVEGLSFCPNCGNRIEEERNECPWEERERYGAVEALFLTWKNSIFSPSNFYRSVPPKGGIRNALIYAIIIGAIGISIKLIWGYIFRAVQVPFMMKNHRFEYLMSGRMLLFLIVLSPIIIVVFTFIGAGIYHICLSIIRGANRDFEATFKAVCYSYGPYLFQIVPICGQLVGSVWIIVMYVIGLREMHRTTTGKAMFAVFLPLILCLGVIFIFIILAFSMMLGKMFR